MEEIKQINIKNRIYYFNNDRIDLKNFDANLLKVDKKDYNRLTFITSVMWLLKKIDDCNNINSVHPLYLMIDETIGHFEEKNESKYLVLDDVNVNKEVSKKYKKVWEGAKEEIKRLMEPKKLNMGKITWRLGLNLMLICGWINL